MENSSKWPVEKARQASAPELETSRLGRVTRRYCTLPGATFFLKGVR